MANIELGKTSNILDVKLTCARGGIVLPCMNGCNTTPYICGVKEGIKSTPDGKGAYCSQKMEPIIIVAKPNS